MIKNWNKFYESTDNQELTIDIVDFIIKLNEYTIPDNRLYYLVNQFFVDNNWKISGGDYIEEEIEDCYELLMADVDLQKSFLQLYNDVMAIWGDLPTFNEILERATNLIDEEWSYDTTVDEEENLLIEFKKEIDFETFLSFLKKLEILVKKLKAITKRDVYVYKAEFHIQYETEGSILIEGKK